MGSNLFKTPPDFNLTPNIVNPNKSQLKCVNYYKGGFGGVSLYMKGYESQVRGECKQVGTDKDSVIIGEDQKHKRSKSTQVVGSPVSQRADFDLDLALERLSSRRQICPLSYKV